MTLDSDAYHAAQDKLDREYDEDRLDLDIRYAKAWLYLAEKYNDEEERRHWQGELDRLTGSNDE